MARTDAPRKDAKLCAEFRGYVEKWNNYFKTNHIQYHAMFAFVFGNQWEDDQEQLLRDYNKVPLTANKIAPLANHTIGEQRMNTPNLQVSPDNDSIPEETVSVRQALVKGISLDSRAKVVYQTAFQQAIIGGFGAYRISSQYLNNKSFDQVPTPTAIKDPTKCFWDVSAETPCKTDGMHAGLYIKMSRRLFRKKYGRAIESTIQPEVTDNDDQNSPSFEWSNEEDITIGECYKRKLINSKIYELSTDDIIDDKQLKQLKKVKVKKKNFDVLMQIDEEDEEIDEKDPDSFDEFLIYNGQLCTIVRQRKVVTFKVKHYKWAGDYILDETDFHSEQLPLIFMDQNSYWDKHGKQVCRPLFKDAKDSQIFINYLVTQIAYLIKISRYDQFMGSRANVKSPKTQLIWKNPSVIQGMLIYDVDKEGGSKPEQIRPPELPITLIQQYERACKDIQTSTGIYNATIGEQGNEISGAAIDARTKQGSYNNYVVFDSCNRAIEVGGEVINEMIPHLIDTKRDVTLEMPDIGMKKVTLNQQADEYGTVVINDMKVGEYKVRLLPGPSYEGQKQEALRAMQLLLTANPQIFGIIADLYAQNLPVPNVIELVNRLRTLVPPEIIEAGKTGKPIEKKQQQPDPAFIIKMKELAIKEGELQAKIQQMKQTANQEDMETKIKIEQMELDRTEAASLMQQHIMSYLAETHRTDTDAQISHAQNIVELLTRPNHLNQPERKNA